MLGIFLDSEANGLNSQKHKIIEIAFKIIDVNTGDLKDQYESVVYQTYEDWQASDLESLRVTGFTWDEVSRGQNIQKVSEQIISSFQKLEIKRGKAAFICQNPSFDRAFFSQIIDPELQEKLLWPYHWLDLASMYWAEAIRAGKSKKGELPWITGFTKDRISSTYRLPSEGMPHRAMNGVNHLLLCYEAVVGFPNV